MTSYVSAELRRLVAARAQGLCEYCLIHESDTFVGCQIDHVISENGVKRLKRYNADLLVGYWPEYSDVREQFDNSEGIWGDGDGVELKLLVR